MERKSSRKIHSQETRDRVLFAYHNGEDWHSVVRILHVPRRTASNWISDSCQNITRNKRGGRKPKRLTEWEIDQLTDWIGDDATMTLKHMQLLIGEKFNKEVCLKTISNHLHNRCIRVKKLYHVTETMNSEENKRRRKLFVESVKSYELDEKYIIWMDETNFNLFCSRTRGRAVSGQKAKSVVANCRGSNPHILGAISDDSMLRYTIGRGSYTESS